MKTINDGGQAFPVALDSGSFYPGMSLRDYFAAVAMLGFFNRGNNNFREIPKLAYEVADKMIEER